MRGRVRQRVNYVVHAGEGEGERELRSACGESEAESELRSACGGE